jgi:hypothetical protein
MDGFTASRRVNVMASLYTKINGIEASDISASHCENLIGTLYYGKGCSR